MSSVVHESKSTLSVSIPANQREAFYAALTVLKEHDRRLFPSASHLIVEAVIAHAARVQADEAASATRSPATQHL